MAFKFIFIQAIKALCIHVMANRKQGGVAAHAN